VPRGLWLVLACGCYAPSPIEALPCSETDRCPTGQRCDLAFHACGAAPLCGTPEIVDSLDQVRAPCAPWGAAFGDAAVDIADGALVVSPRSDGQNGGGCLALSSVAFVDGGIFLEVPAVLPARRGTTELTVESGVGPSIAVHDGMIELATSASSVATRPYDATAMRWWRLRPDHTTRHTVGEYAADGSHWTQLGIVEAAAPTRITIQFGVDVAAADPSPGTARFHNLDVCPGP
jgi:hypothetical protein